MVTPQIKNKDCPKPFSELKYTQDSFSFNSHAMHIKLKTFFLSNWGVREGGGVIQITPPQLGLCHIALSQQRVLLNLFCDVVLGDTGVWPKQTDL